MWAHVTLLRRLAVSDYPADKMMTLAELQALAEQQAETLSFEALDNLLLPIDSAVIRLPQIILDAQQSKAVGFGQRVKFDNPQQFHGQVRLFSDENLFLGVAVVDERNIIRPSRMVVR